MDVYTVRDNLKNTIAGKKLLLSKIRNDNSMHCVVQTTTIIMLNISITELETILADVEQCCVNATNDSWAISPDRSGGAFTDAEELERHRNNW